MVRSLALLAALAACGSERTPVTARVATLGYSHPPAIVVVSRGADELVEPWLAGLRASGYARIVAEVKGDDVPTEDDAMCKRALEAANVTPIEEIVVIQAVETDAPIDECLPTATAPCARRSYAGLRIHVNTTVTTYRASTCTVRRTTSMPGAAGTSGKRAPLDYDQAHEGTELEEAKNVDRREARGPAIEQMLAFAPRVSWRIFPTDSSIQRVEDRRIVIAGPLELGEYFLKTPHEPALKPGVRAVSVERNQTTLEIDAAAGEPEPGDELHGVTDMMTFTGYTTLTGGVVRAGGKAHGIGGASLVGRWAWDRSPKLFEMQLAGELAPGIDSRHAGVGLAVGVRVPYWIAPFVLVELGLGGVYQGDHGARAVAGRAGIGAGLEVRRTRWFLYADLRLRGYALGEFTDSEDNPLTVDHTDRTWGTTTAQLGMGWSL